MVTDLKRRRPLSNRHVSALSAFVPTKLCKTGGDLGCWKGLGIPRQALTKLDLRPFFYFNRRSLWPCVARRHYR